MIPMITSAGDATVSISSGQAMAVEASVRPPIQRTWKRSTSEPVISFPAIPATPDRLTIHAAFERDRSEEHTSELQSLMRISYAVFCLKKNKIKETNRTLYIE